MSTPCNTHHAGFTGLQASSLQARNYQLAVLLPCWSAYCKRVLLWSILQPHILALCTVNGCIAALHCDVATVPLACAEAAYAQRLCCIPIIVHWLLHMTEHCLSTKAVLTATPFMSSVCKHAQPLAASRT